MGKVRVNGFTISADGYGAGVDQTLEKPMGEGVDGLHDWMIETAHFAGMFGREGGSTGVDNDYAKASMDGLGAWIMGRNMFGPVRGDWPDYDWKGWWGDVPPYHCPVYVLTHHARPPLEMADTVFHFVTGGPEEALRLAKDAAGDKDIRIGGGAETVRQYLALGAIDTLHVAVSPILIGKGEALFAGLDLPALGYALKAQVAGEKAVHLTIARA